LFLCLVAYVKTTFNIYDASMTKKQVKMQSV